MHRKITIIGAGSVGSTIAFMMTIKGIAAEIVMIDINKEKAEGESMDIRQGTAFTPPVKIYSGSYEDAAGSQIVVITSGLARKPGQSRLDLAQTNVDILKSIAPQITKVAPDAIYILVSNPVDVLTYVFHKVTNIPENRILGTGTLLDTARLRSRLSDYLNISQENIDAFVLGEHGDSAFIPWSVSKVCSLPLAEYQQRLSSPDEKTMELNYEEIEQYVRTSGGQIIARKGATFYAVSISVCHICECIFSNANTILPLSTMMHGEYGVDDICLSLPTFIDASGLGRKLLLQMSDSEIGQLRHSSETLKKVIAQLNI